MRLLLTSAAKVLFAEVLVLGAPSTLLGGAHLNSAQAATEGRLDQFIRAEMERQRVPGVAVAVVKQGEVAFVRGFGYANVEHVFPVRPETIFQSGSLAKQFTATAVMLLVQDGKLGLDHSVTEYLSEAPREWKPITLRHLLNHTSGIPDYESAVDLRRDYSETDFEKVAMSLRLESPAGSRWNYSNTGYVLLGNIVRRVSGRSWGDLLHERVFASLGMTTARLISEEDIVPNRAAGYRLVNGELRNQEWVAPSLNTGADGGLYLTVLDLIAWDRGLRSKTILNAESWSQIFEPARLKSGRRYPYGFGWQLANFAGQTVQWHGGEWQGFTSYIARYLEDDLTVVVLTNLAEGRPSRFVHGIAALLDPKLVPADPVPILDREPAVTSRLKVLLTVAPGSSRSSSDLPYTYFPFFPTGWKGYKASEPMLHKLGAPDSLDLIERHELGDDTIYTYLVRYPGTTLRVAFGLTPDGGISHFSLRVQEQQ
jgi:CubicO group peptidase (beta-lactamase class C family)